jgi:hypothetical protein
MTDLLDLELLVDRNEIATIMGVGPTAVSNYVSRTSDRQPPFPDAVISRSLGRFRLYDINEVEQWHGKAFPQRSEVWDDAIDRLRQFRLTYCGETG